MARRFLALAGLLVVARRVAGRAIRHDERRMALVCRRAGQHEVLPARSDQQRQRQEPAHRVAVQDRQLRRAARLQHAGDAADGERRHVRAGGRAPRGRRDRSRNGRAVVDVAHGRGQARRRRAAPGIGPRRRVLDRRQGRRAHSHRHARLSPRRAEREDRRARSIVRPQRHRRSQDRARSAGPRSDDGRHRPQRAAGGRQQRRRRRRRAHAGQRAAHERKRQGLRPRLRRAHRQAALDLPHHSAARRRRATRRGRTTRGRTRATPATGAPSPSTKQRIACISRPRWRPATTTAVIVPARTCSPTASSASISTPANATGTSRRSITTSGTGTSPLPAS